MTKENETKDEMTENNQTISENKQHPTDEAPETRPTEEITEITDNPTTDSGKPAIEPSVNEDDTQATEQPPLTTPSDTLEPTLLETKEKQSNSWIKIALLLLVISFGLFAANPIYQYFTTQKIKSDLKEVKLKDLAEIQTEVDVEPAIDLSDKELYIGKIAIPAVKLALPIVKGSGEENLFRGAATNTNNQQLGQGNYSLSSHKMPYDDTLLFSPLLRVKMGDKIYLTEGKFAYEYKTTEIFVVSPDKVEILDEIPGKIVTTLYTCETDAGTERHVVRGELETVIPLENLDKKIAKMLD